MLGEIGTIGAPSTGTGRGPAPPRSATSPLPGGCDERRLGAVLDFLFTHLSTGVAGGPGPQDLSFVFWACDAPMVLATPLLLYSIFAKRRVLAAARRETAPAVAADLVAGPTTLVGVATVEDENNDGPIVLVSEQAGKEAADSGGWFWTESSRRLLDRPFGCALVRADAKRLSW